MRFLIDECLSPSLLDVASEQGFLAYHVAYRKWSGLKDPQVLGKLLEEELILVTNNRDDFLGIMANVELHPGLVVIMENVPRDQQMRLFGTALEVLARVSSMVNKVLEVSSDGSIAMYDLPSLE